MTPELQAQHHNRISKRELAKEFDGLVEEMQMDKMQLHFSCGGTAPKVVAAHEAALKVFAEHAMNKAVDALDAAILSAEEVNPAYWRNGLMAYIGATRRK